MSALEKFWSKLSTIKEFTYESTSGPGSKTEWDGRASGSVNIEQNHEENWIQFFEQCEFKLKNSHNVFHLKNKYRWTLRKEDQTIRLEHWRREYPVYLLDLKATGRNSLSEVKQHVCVNDLYRLTVNLTERGFDAIWRITGPKKNEKLYYSYT